MNSPQSEQETRDGLRATCIAIYFVISLTLTFLFYWNSWQWWSPTQTDWVWHFLAFCAPFPAAVWLGANAPSLPPRQSALLGLLAGAGGFLLHLLTYGVYKGQLPPPNWPLSLCACVLGGALLCPSGYVIGSRFPSRRSDSEPDDVSAPRRGRARATSQSPNLIYIQTMLGFLGPIIVAFIDRNR
jgi:hypothetical protein